MGNIPYDQVCDMYTAGYSGPEVAQTFGISSGYVYTLLKGRGIARRVHLTSKERDEAMDAYRLGENLTSIARRYGKTKEPMRQLAIRRGIPIRGVSESQRRYYCNDHFFDAINYEAPAYWLGFIGADGCVLKDRLLTVKLAATDSEHLERLRTALQATNPVAIRTSKTGYKANSHRAILEINSPALVAGLGAHGVHAAKSLTHEWPHFLAASLLPHYLRGCFDGDGCFGTRRSGRGVTYQAYATLCGSEDFLLWCRYYLQTRLGFSANKLQMNGAIHPLAYAGNRQIAKFAHLLYDDATTYLPRKRDKIAHLLEPR